MNPPPTGVAVVITHKHKILVGLREQEPNNCWQLPGGFMQIGETPNQAIARVVLLKTNLKLHNEQIIALTNNVFSLSEHTISLIFTAKCKDPTKLINTGSQNGYNWYWTTWNELPTPLFLPFQTLVDNGYHPFIPYKRDARQNKDNHCFIF